MTTKRKIITSTFLKIILIIVLSVTLTQNKAAGQVFEVKKWTGTYPDMNGSYPLTFIAFKGWIIPVPFVFVRTWPTHYYVNLESLLVTDATAIAGEIKTGLLRIAAKLLEQSQMKGRFEKTTGIKNNTELQNEIEKKLFNARFDELEDFWELAWRLNEVYDKTGRFDQLNTGAAVKNILEKEADELLLRFLMVNLLESGHGQKVDSYNDLQTEIIHLSGEVDYTFKKLQYFESFDGSATQSYSFLTQ